MKKIIIIIAFFISSIFIFASCTEEQLDGFNEGMNCVNNGYEFIGYYDTSECRNACADYGYTYYCTGHNTTWCGCK